MTGKIGPYNIGFLQVQTRKLGKVSTGLGIPRQQFSVLRVKRDILKRSYIGAILVNRQGATSVGGSRYNRVGGADAEFNRPYGQRILSLSESILPDLTKRDEPIFTGLAAVKVTFSLVTSRNKKSSC